MVIPAKVGGGEDQAAYFWDAAMFSARSTRAGKLPAEFHLKNADNYRMFAMAVFLDKTTWSVEGRKQ